MDAYDALGSSAINRCMISIFDPIKRTLVNSKLFTTELAPIAPSRGACWGEINIYGRFLQ